MMSYHDFRKYLRETGPELVTYEQSRAIVDKRMKEIDKEYKARKKNQHKDCPLIRGEGFSFLLSQLLKKKKSGPLTLDEIKELKLKKAKTIEHFNDCCEKLGVRELVLGKGVVKSGPTEDEIKNEQFEHMKELMEERNKFDTWVLHDDTAEKNETKTSNYIDLDEDLMKIVEEKKRKMKEESIKNIRKAESARRYFPTLPFYF
ncbi:uncharacterized protein [Halyomorpha halys]|uniref:uncharacterized protein n=1 Tax=Halyomorpha halys TaxID=286706 RepID=UPI0006D513C8|nr:uncharacterized protein LOC106679781 [Halyomorpha halys]